MKDLHTRPAFNTKHRFVCQGNPDGKSGADVVAQVYGPDVDKRAAILAAAPDLLAAAKHYLECFEHVDRTDYTGRDTEQTMRNFREIFTAAIAKAEGQP